ncbi:hypothetical protein [Nonomuraea sp. NPDC049400]|uniref:hypothetical protein n=1 Tax=Nonomuraea sp. NPDC049400 TaxID=3364352 RepID=UPI003799BCFB
MSPLLNPWIGFKCTGYGGLDLTVMENYGAQLAGCTDNDLHVTQVLQTLFAAVLNLGELTAVDWSAAHALPLLDARMWSQEMA